MAFDEWGTDSTWEQKLKLFIDLAGDCAESKARLMNLENVKKTILATAAKASPEKSIGGKERDAYLSIEYSDWCKEYFEAVRVYEGQRLRLEAMKIWFDMARSQMATKRAEMTLM